jgi:hypothetical protein
MWAVVFRNGCQQLLFSFRFFEHAGLPHPCGVQHVNMRIDQSRQDYLTKPKINQAAMGRELPAGYFSLTDVDELASFDCEPTDYGPLLRHRDNFPRHDKIGILNPENCRHEPEPKAATYNQISGKRFTEEPHSLSPP